MTENKGTNARGRAVIRWVLAAAFIFAVIISGLFTGMMNKAGLFYLLLGSAACVLMGFSRKEIVSAFRNAAGRPGLPEDLKRAAYFWEAASRNAWILGVLGSVLNFTIVLGGGGKEIPDISNRMIQSFVVTLYGLVLAVVFLVPAIKLTDMAGKAGYAEGLKPIGGRALLFERVTGYVLFAVVLALTVFSLVRDSPQDGPLPIAKVMLHGPAALVIFGGAIALALFMGTGAKTLTFGFGMTGLIALLLGLIQTMFGFVHADIKEIAAAVAFIIAASLYSLLGLVLVAAPFEDRELMDGRREKPERLGRMFWRVFPLLAFVFLLLTFLMVITPMKKTG